MDNREWMYTGHPSHSQVTREWMDKTEKFLDHALKEAKGAGDAFCPCSQCKNKKRKKEVMLKDLCNYGFMPNYSQ
jgi:hypothetical protein